MKFLFSFNGKKIQKFAKNEKSVYFHYLKAIDDEIMILNSEN